MTAVCQQTPEESALIEHLRQGAEMIDDCPELGGEQDVFRMMLRCMQDRIRNVAAQRALKKEAE